MKVIRPVFVLIIRSILFCFILPLNVLSAGDSQSEYHKYRGTIGTAAITMNLTRIDSAIYGDYYFNNIRIPLDIYGKLIDNNHFELEEFDSKNDQTGILTLNRLTGEMFLGSWKSPNSTKSLPVNLYPLSDSVVKVQFKHFQKEDCAQAEKNKFNFTEDMSYSDTMCSTFDLVVPQFITSNNPALVLTNHSLLDSLCGCKALSEQNAIDQLMGRYFDSGNDGPFEFTRYPIMFSNERNYVSICFSSAENYFGAHLMYYYQSYNFSSLTGKLISLNDLFIPGTRAELNRIAEREFVAANGAEDWFFDPGKFEVNENFRLTPGGIRFDFDPYEIGPFSAGAPSVFIKYSTIFHLLKKDSPIFGLPPR